MIGETLRIPPDHRVDRARRHQPREPLLRTVFKVLGAVSASHDRPRGVLPVGPGHHRHRQLRRLRPVEHLADLARRRHSPRRPHSAAAHDRSSSIQSSTQRSASDERPDRHHARARRAHHHHRRRQRHRHALEHRPGRPPNSRNGVSARQHPAERPARRSRLRRWPSTISASPVTASPRSPRHDRETARRPCCSTSAPTATSGSPTPNDLPSICPASTCCSCRTGTGTTPAASPPSSPPSPRPARAPVVRRSSSMSTPTGPTSVASSRHSTSSRCCRRSPPSKPSKRPAVDVVTHAEVHDVADLFLASGDIPRQTSYETGLPGHHSWHGDQVTLDPGDPRRALPRRQRARPRNDGAHRLLARRRRQRRPRSTPAPSRPTGRRAARRLPPRRHNRRGPHRTHRARPQGTRRPRIVAPGHCTGWRAAAALTNAFSPTGYAPSVVGTRYVLKAS